MGDEELELFLCARPPLGNLGTPRTQADARAPNELLRAFPELLQPGVGGLTHRALGLEESLLRFALEREHGERPRELRFELAVLWDAERADRGQARGERNR